MTDLDERPVMPRYRRSTHNDPDFSLGCSFPNCMTEPASSIGLPICTYHAKQVYLAVKDLIDSATGRTLAAAIAQKPSNGNTGRAWPEQKKTAVGVVYFARIGDLIKIGFTTNLSERMKHLKVDEVLATMPGTMLDEDRMHAKFGPYWVRGELFRPEPELVAFAANL